MRRPMLPIAVVMTFVLSACARPPGGAGDESCSPVPMPSGYPSTFDAPADEAGQVVQAYGEAHADEFAGVYFDNDHGHRLTARFTACVELHQAALDALLGGPDRVLVLDAVFTEATLAAILEDHEGFNQLAEHDIALVSAGVDVIHNNVEIIAKSDNPEAERILQALGPPGAVVVDLYPADKPWTQPTEGSGWRLLGGGFDTDLPYTVAVALDPPRLAAEWDRYGLPGDPRAWDPSREIVFILSDGIGSSCTELRLDAVVMDIAAGVVHGEFSDPFQPRGCTADLAGGKTFVVAVERDRLPPSPFTLRIRAQPIGCEPDCGSGLSTLIVDLR